MNRRVLQFALLLVAVSTLSSVAAAEDPEGVSVTLKGEILDLHCYMLHPDTGSGPDHAKCANSCIARGLPAGFLSDGQVYMLLGAGHGAASELVAGHAGSAVTVVGKLVEHHGMRAIQLASVDAGGGSASQTQPTGEHDH